MPLVTIARARRVVASALSASLVAFASGVSQGTVRVHADQPPAWGEHVTLRRVVQVGDGGGSPPFAVSSVERIATRPDGAFYAYDRTNTQIWKFDADGTLIGRLGRMGSDADDEYLKVGGLDVVGDTLVVLDPRRNRITLFGSHGGVSQVTNFKKALNWGYSFHMVDSARLAYLPIAAPVGPDGGDRFLFLRVRLDGSVVDTLDPGRFPKPTRGFALDTPEGDRGSFGTWGDAQIWPSGGLLVVPRNDAYAFELRGSGGTVIQVSKSYTPVTLTRDERAEWLAWSSYMASREHLSRPTPIPTRKPAFRDVETDRFGRVWVQLYARAERRRATPRSAGDRRPLLTWHERNVYDVFSPKGEYLARITLPTNSRLMAIGESRVWLITTNPSGPTTLGVYDIVRGERP